MLQTHPKVQQPECQHDRCCAKGTDRVYHQESIEAAKVYQQRIFSDGFRRDAQNSEQVGMPQSHTLCYEAQHLQKASPYQHTVSSRPTPPDVPGPHPAPMKPPHPMQHPSARSAAPAQASHYQHTVSSRPPPLMSQDPTLPTMKPPHPRQHPLCYEA